VGGVAVPHPVKPWPPTAAGSLPASERPHDALDLATPASRCRVSHRSFPEQLAAFDYDAGAILRRVDDSGWVSFKARPIKLGRAFACRQAALRPALPDGCFEVFLCGHTVARFDLRATE